MENLVGAPGSRFSITDLSIIIANSLNGKICVQGVTEKGIAGEVEEVGNWEAFKKKFGGLLDADDFPLMCKRALEKGAVLKVGRALHYTDIDDITTFEGTKASDSITDDTDVIAFEALGVGSGYNKIGIETKASKNGISGYIDIVVTIPGLSNTVEVVGLLATAITTTDIAKINSQLKSKFAHVKISSITGQIPIGTCELANGVITLANIVAADYNGSSIAKNGWHMFDNVTDSMRIMNFNKADADVDVGLAAYVVARKDMIATLRTPLGLTVSGLTAYLAGTSPYTHTRIDTMYANYWLTDVEITDPNNADIRDKKISALGDWAGLRAMTDKIGGEWRSAAGYEFGRITGINKIPLNLLSQGNKSDFDNLYEAGLNAIVNHDQFGPVAWGNRNTMSDKSKLTSKQNIADMCVFIGRTLVRIANTLNFQPNDFPMFNLFYRKALPFIKNILVDGRAIQGDKSAKRGEGTWWHWFGDQFAETPADLTFNTTDDIDQGKYRVRFAFKPIASNEYIAIDVAPADSATILNVEVLTSL